MELVIELKAKGEKLLFKGDRIEVLDFTMDNVQYKQIRYFRKGFSKSQYIKSDLIKKITEKS